MAKRFYPAVFTPEETGFSVAFPDLPGCFSEGDTLEEAYEMGCAALGLYLEAEGGTFVYPPASIPGEIACAGGAFVALVEFDEDDYRRRHGTQLVKKTLTIPAWVNAAAEKRGINFSSALTDTLVRQIQAQ